ncbi:MAG TPA: CPBP family intramembrane glutamic endopeptidase [Actinomycetes bacterium]
MTLWRGGPAAPPAPRPGLAMALVVALATAGNLATNLLAPAALYVPTALVVAAAAVALAVRVGGCGARDLGLAGMDLARGLRYGAAAMAVVAGLLAVGVALPAARELFADRRVHEHSVAALLYATLVRIPFGTALLEETLFRGVLLGLGLRQWPPGVAVAWSSALFGLWHVLPAGGLAGYNTALAGTLHGAGGRLLVTAAAVAACALAGVVFCWLRLRAGSLLAPVMLHLATNGLAYATAWLLLQGR